MGMWVCSPTDWVLTGDYRRVCNGSISSIDGGILVKFIDCPNWVKQLSSLTTCRQFSYAVTWQRMLICKLCRWDESPTSVSCWKFSKEMAIWITQQGKHSWLHSTRWLRCFPEHIQLVKLFFTLYYVYICIKNNTLLLLLRAVQNYICSSSIHFPFTSHVFCCNSCLIHTHLAPFKSHVQ